MYKTEKKLKNEIAISERKRKRETTKTKWKPNSFSFVNLEKCVESSIHTKFSFWLVRFGKFLIFAYLRKKIEFPRP
jgi:hypothetical protein